MPLREESENMYYSIDIGPVHFIAVSTEFYYYTNYGMKMVANQYKWLVEDLKVWKQLLRFFLQLFKLKYALCAESSQSGKQVQEALDHNHGPPPDVLLHPR